MSSLRKQILSLRKKGKSYLQIVQALGCSKSSVSYNLNPEAKEQRRQRQWRNRTKSSEELKRLHGGKCSVCGYSKCLAALEFHHKDKATKKLNISDKGAGWRARANEAKKCVLLCANCHRELHAGII